MSQTVKGNFPSEVILNSNWPQWFYPNGPQGEAIAVTSAQKAQILKLLQLKVATESTGFSVGGFDQTNWRGFQCTIKGTPDVIPPPILYPLRLKKTDNRVLWSQRTKNTEIIIGDYAKGKAIITQQLGTEVISTIPRYGYFDLNVFGIGYQTHGTALSGRVCLPGLGWFHVGHFRLWYEQRTQVSGKSPANAGFSTVGLQQALVGYTDLVIDSELVTEVLAKANQGDLDLLTFYAELPETVKSFYDLLKRIIKIAAEMKQKEFRWFNQLKKKTTNKKIKYIVVNGVEVADELASLRLRYRYEIVPLVLSLTDLAKSLNVPVKTFVTTTKRVVTDPKPFGFSGWASQEQHGQNTNRAWCKRAFSIDENTQFTRAFSQDIAVTAFELITGSFILDWAFNLGDYVAALNLFSADAHSHEGFSFSSKFEGNLILRPAGVTSKNGPQVGIEIQSYELKVINPREHICVIPSNGLFGDIARELDLAAFAWMSFSSRFKKS